MLTAPAAHAAQARGLTAGRWFALLFLATTALAHSEIACAQSQLTVGKATAGTDNCVPFGCNRGDVRFQQSYAPSAFSGPITIESITFYNTVIGPTRPTNALVPGTFSVYLGYAAQTPLTTAFTSNVSSERVFATFVTGATVVGSSFTFSGTPYYYDPSLGALLLDVRGTALGNQQTETFFDVDCGGPSISSCYVNGHYVGTSNVLSVVDSLGDYGVESYQQGLVTTFGGTTSTPEPPSLTLLGTGLLAVAPLRRRKH